MRTDDGKREEKEYREREVLVERGRQLHSLAVFEMCANLLRRRKNAQADTRAGATIKGLRAGTAA